MVIPLLANRDLTPVLPLVVKNISRIILGASKIIYQYRGPVGNSYRKEYFNACFVDLCLVVS